VSALPLVTVCIPSFNSERTIERCLVSVSMQDYQNTKIIVVDDCSSDNTVQLCRAYSDNIEIIKNDRNLGIVGNHNRCIELADGKYLKFVHADDYLLPGAISKMVSSLEKYPDASLAFSRRYIESTVEEFVRDASDLHVPLEPLSEYTKGVLLIERFIRAGARRNLFGEPTSMMFNREAMVRSGGFSSHLPQLFDIEFCLAILAHGAAVWINEPLSVRVHTSDTTSELNRATGVGSLDPLKIQLALTRSPVLSPWYRWDVARLATVSLIKAIGKILIYRRTRPRLVDLVSLTSAYVAGDIRSPGKYEQAVGLHGGPHRAYQGQVDDTQRHDI